MMQADAFIRKDDLYTRFRHISVKDGLGADQVFAILQDTHRVMWFATMNGLTRYDSHTFVHYRNNEEDDFSLSDNRVTSLAEDTFGNLWVGTQNGLNRYDRHRNAFIRYPALSDNINSPRSNKIRSLYADPEGLLWIESEGGFLSRLDVVANEWKHVGHASSSTEGDYYFHPIYEDSDRNLWIGGRNIAPFRYIGKDMNRQVDITYNFDITYCEGRCYVETEEGDLLLGNYPDELVRFNPSTNKIELITTLGISPVAALRDSDGALWFGGDPGLIRLDWKKKEIVHFKNNPIDSRSLISNKIYCLYRDRDNCIWIGTDRGISLYSDKLNAIRHYRRLEGNSHSMTSNAITALMQDRDGLIWIGTAEHGVDTFSLEHERFGNLTYDLLRPNLDKQTFEREKEVLRQYFRHEFIQGDKTTKENVFDTYNTFQKAPLQFKEVNENKVSSLYQDREGKLYIGLWSHVGFNSYDKKENIFKRYALWSRKPDRYYPRVFEGNPFGANWYSGFLEDDRLNFWCATWEAFGLNLFNRQTGQFEGKHYIPADKPRNTYLKLSLDPVRKRMFMCGGFYYGYYDMQTASYERYGGLIPDDYTNKDIFKEYYRYCRIKQVDIPVNNVWTDYVLQDDIVWLGDSYSIVKHWLNTDSFQTVYTNTVASNMIFAESGDPRMIWVGTDKVLRQINKENDHVRTIVTLDSISIRFLYEDETGLLWIGTDKGIYSWNNMKKELLQKGSERDPIRSIAGNKKEKTVYVASSTGLSRWVGGKETDRLAFYSDSSRVLPGTGITTLYLNPDGYLYVGTNGGLAVFDPQGRDIQVYTHNPDDRYSLIDNAIYSICEDMDANLWIMTSKGLCMRIQGETTFTDLSMTDDRTLTSRLTSCILQDRVGKIWIGTTENGISVLDTVTDRMKHYIHQDWNTAGISDNYVHCIYEGPVSGLWVGSRKGLDKYDREQDRFESIKELKGLSVVHIEEDNAGNVWAATQEGLFYLKVSGELIRQITGFPGLSQWNFSGAGYKLRNGELVWGGNDGIYRFNPAVLGAKQNPPSLQFTHFRVDDSVRYYDIPDTASVELSYGDNSFSIQFVASDYVFAGYFQYRYRLDGFEENWNYTKAPVLSARYLKVPSGKYTFVVEVSTIFGEWEEVRRELPIHILTPWYRQLWFVMLNLLLIAGCFYLYLRLRERKLQEEKNRLECIVEERTMQLREANEKLSKSEKVLKAMNESKNKFFSIISHDLRNPLKALDVTSQSLYEQYDQLSEEEKLTIIRVIHETTGHTHILLENLLIWVVSQMNLLKPSFRQIGLSSLIDENIELMRLQAQKKELHLINKLSSELVVWTDTHLLSTILRNLLSNAIHFSYPGADIYVFAEDKGDQVEVSVVDTGTGISLEDQKKLFRLDMKIRTHGTENEQGTGLGLIITREFVHLLGGEIRVESEPGRGSTFLFTLNKIPKNEVH